MARKLKVFQPSLGFYDLGIWRRSESTASRQSPRRRSLEKAEREHAKRAATIGRTRKKIASRGHTLGEGEREAQARSTPGAGPVGRTALPRSYEGRRGVQRRGCPSGSCGKKNRAALLKLSTAF